MWKPDEIASSSDESFEEEIPTSNFGKFDTATGACKLKSVFDDIFADIQANIPTLELEKSSEESDNDEEPVLYTREAWPLSPMFSLQTSSPSSKVNNSPAASASDSGLFLVSPDRHTTSSSSISDCEQDSIEFLGSSPSFLPSTLQTKSVALISTQTTCTDEKPSERQTSTDTSPVVKTSNHTTEQETVELRFDLLEHLNLNDYLVRTNEVTVPPVFPPILCDSSSDDADDGTSLMEELVRLSRKQQSNAVPEPVSPADHHARGMPENKKNKKQDVGVMSGPSVSSRGVTASLDPSTPSRSTSTVFLDLRKQEEQNLPQKHQALPSSICRILGISHDAQSDLSSSSDEEDDLQYWQDQRRKVKEASLSCARQNSSNLSRGAAKKTPTKHKHVVEESKPDHKEDNVKLDKTVVQDLPREENTRKIIETGKALEVRSISNILDNVRLHEKNEEEVLKDLREIPVRQAWTASSVGCKNKSANDSILSVGETKTTTTYTPPEQEICHSTAREQRLHVSSPKENASEVMNNKISTEKTDQLSSVDVQVKKELNAVVNEGLKKPGVRHKHVLTEEEKAKRQRLQKSLQNLKPQLSSHKRHSAAPCTPVLFHEEASYESHVLSLPSSLHTNTSYLLMSAKLSSCGELTVIRQGARGGVTPDTHCLSILIAWLSCLVSSSVNTTDYAKICGAPFYVVGLQQSWHEGQLKIEIGICSQTMEKGEQSSVNDVKGKAKNKPSNSFRHAVSKFLSTNTLHSVYARLLECTPCPLQYLAEISISKRNLSTLLTVNPDPDAMERVFAAKPGFFWQTTEMGDAPTDEKASARLCQGPEIQNTVMLMQYAVFHQPFCLLDVLIRVRNMALDMAGFRLVYQEEGPPLKEKPAHRSEVSTDIPALEETCTGSQVPLLVLALRGPRAISQCQDEVGPVDAKLAQRTDPKSLRALYSHGAKEDHLFWCPRNVQSAVTELARWFGGRVPESGVVNIGSSEPVVTLDEKPRGSPGKGRNAKTQLLTSSLHNTCRPPPYFVTACTDTSVFFIVSPALPVKYLGRVMSVCFERGYCTQGIKRVHLNTNRLSGLGLAPEQLNVFCPKRVTQTGRASPSPVASTVLLLRRENALHHTLPVVKSLVDSFADIGLSQSCFLSIPYSDSMLKQLGGDLSVTPDPAAYPVDLLRHAFHSNPELEQVCVLTLLKDKASISACSILNQLLLEKESQESEKEKSNLHCGFELLGLKLLTSLSLRQAKEFTPCKIGDGLWKKSLHILTAGPALVLALRGVNGFARLQRFVDSYLDSSKSKRATDSISFDMLMSCTPELACRQLSVIFFDRELFSDQSARRNLHLLPPPRRVINGVSSGSSESLNESETRGSSPNRKARNRRVGLSKSSLKPSLSRVETLWYADMSVIQSLLERPRVIPTVCVLKPRTATKHLGKVLKRLGQEGFSVIGMKMMRLSSGDVSTLMAEKGSEVERHACHMTSGPVVALCLQRENAVGRLLEVLGPSDPRAARKQSQFFLRGSFGEDSIQNAFYGSETYQEAIRDIKLLFPEGVCCRPSIDLKAEEIPCLALDEVFSVTANRALVELSTEEQSRVDSGPGMTLLPSSLLEINCFLLLPQLLASRSQPSRRSNIVYAEIIEALLTAGFHFIGLRMVLLGVAEAADCAKLYSSCLPADWKPHQLAGHLSKSPCLAMAVLRDGAVTCYDSLCDSSPKLKSLAANSGRFLLAGKTIKEAKRMVECFFDTLIPNRKARIELKTP